MKNKSHVIECLNAVVEREFAGVVYYTNCAAVVFGPNRMPLIEWLREQATESLAHAVEAADHLVSLGGFPNFKVGKLPPTRGLTVHDILTGALESEKIQIENLVRLRDLVEGKSVSLEEYALEMICEEETHVSEIEKMLRASK